MSTTPCERCGRHDDRRGTLATRRIEWRENGDYPHWPNRVTLRCDRCAADLYAWLGVAHPDNYGGRAHGTPRGTIERDDDITKGRT